MVQAIFTHQINTFYTRATTEGLTNKSWHEYSSQNASYQKH